MLSLVPSPQRGRHLDSTPRKWWVEVKQQRLPRGRHTDWVQMVPPYGTRSFLCLPQDLRPFDFAEGGLWANLFRPSGAVLD